MPAIIHFPRNPRGEIQIILASRDCYRNSAKSERSFSSRTMASPLMRPRPVKTPRLGKYIVVWKKGDDGTWRLHRDIWNLGAAQ
ncbi:MAG: hypothetical protein E5X37_28660 [Mesorhizobium sp.]|nr:MAG: hypothetical protein E5X37_28660 [Mesorhizobium sp.]